MYPDSDSFRQASGSTYKNPHMKGLDYRPDAKAWRVHITINGHRLYLGYYKTEAEAEEIRKMAESICGTPTKGPHLLPSKILIDREVAFVQLSGFADADIWCRIDSEDVDKVANYRWSNNKGYAENGYVGLMHRVLMGAEKSDLDIDHIDRDRLNNRKRNMRLCTHCQNMQNISTRKGNVSGVRGVVQEKSSGKWTAGITVNRKRHFLGRFSSMEDAIKARRDAENRLGGI